VCSCAQRIGGSKAETWARLFYGRLGGLEMVVTVIREFRKLRCL
jgi:hypothetical protein